MTDSPVYRRHVAPAGSSPGTYNIREGAFPSQVHTMTYKVGELEEHDPASAAEARALIRDGYVTWIDVHGLGTEPLLEEFESEFNLHRLAVADVVNVGQRPKVEDYGNVLFMVLRMVTLTDEHAVHWEQVSGFLGRNFVLTFQEEPGDCLDPLRARIRDSKPLLRQSGADYLAIMILDGIIDGYFPILEEFGEKLEELESLVLRSPEPAVLSQIYSVKRELMTLRRAAWPLRDALNGLLRDGHDLIEAPTLHYLRDAADHVMQVVDVVESYRDLSAGLVDVYLSSLGNKTNDVMRVLTVIATIFIPLTFVAGIYGMNFDTASGFNMPELGWKYGYVAFWAVCLGLGVGLLGLFWRFGWLGRSRTRIDPD